MVGDEGKGKQVQQPVTHSGNVFRGEFVCCVGDEETGLPDSAIADDDTFNGLHSDDGRWRWTATAGSESRTGGRRVVGR